MAEEQRQNGAYTKGEMVRIAVNDKVQPDPVPAAWIGTDLVPAGAKKATRAQIAKADGGDDTGDPTPPVSDPDAEPAGNASRDEWAEYAVRVKGAKPEDLIDDQGEPLGRDMLREKYGAPAS